MSIRILLFAVIFLALLPCAIAAGGGARGKEFTALGDRLNEAQRAGDLALAEDLARQRLAVAQGGPERMLGNSYRNLGNVLRMRGKFKDAELMLRQALPLIERGNGRDSFQAIRTLFNLGVLLTAQARYGEAQTLLRDALDRQLRSEPQNQDAIQIYNAQANVARQLGHYADAEALLAQADATSGTPQGDNDKGHRDDFALRRLRVQTLLNHAQLRYQQGRYADTATEARRAMDGFVELEGAGHMDYANAQTLLGLALLQLAERREEAESVLRAAVALDERVLGRGHRETGRAVWGLALVLQRNGKAAEAEPLLKRAIDSAAAAGASRQQAIDERSYARLLVQRQRYGEALTHYRQSLDLIDRMFAHTRGLDDATREGYIAQFAPYYGEMLQLLLRLHRQHPELGHDREALAIVSRTQSRLFTEMLRKSDADQHSNDPEFVALRLRQDELNAQFAELQRARTISGYEAADGDEDTNPAARSRSADPIVMERVAVYRKELDRDIVATSVGLTRVEAELWRRNPRYMELTQPRPVSVDTLQKTLLKPGETLLSYYLLADRVLIFLVEREKFHLYEVARPRQEIAALIDAVRRPEESVGSASSAPDNLASLDPQRLFALYQALFAPLVGELKPGQRLLVIGDGPLHTLPLEMLIERWGEAERRAFTAARTVGQPRLGEYATLPYLARKHHFAYLPSLASLASIRLYRKSAVRYERELVSFADPVFEKGGYAPTTQTALATLSRAVAPGRRLDIPRLPETADEAREIAAILDGQGQSDGRGRSQVFLREQAQEHTAKTLDLKATRYLHFATHGLLGGEFVAVREALATNEQVGDDKQRNLTVKAVSTSVTDAPIEAAAPDIDESAPRPGVERGQPALLLSLSGDMQGEDGLLTMSEVIESLDLNARLVVLSACNTAGEAQAASSGEGFAGLTRAFMYAGAQGILVSHWSVESRATQLLMSELFRNLRQDEKEDSLAALERARESIRASSDAAQNGLSRAHPYFWAPFVYVGD